MTTALRRLTSAPSRALLGAYVPARTASWPKASRLFVVGDELGWSIDDDRVRLTAAARRLGYEVAPPSWARFARNQAVFHPNHFDALQPRWLESPHRIGLSYFHGRPGTAGYPEFDRAFELLNRNAAQVDRVQVTHAEMHGLVIAAGVDPDRVFRIRIGVDIERFPLAEPGDRASARSAFGIPESAFVVGSFLKDGVGMADGSEPKLVKGPDTLVATVGRLRASIPELFVFLTGPARGFVRRELERLGIAHHHVSLGSRDALVSLDGGGPAATRLKEVADAVEAAGSRVYRVTAAELGESLSIFPLTVAVQRIALDFARQLGTDPDEVGSAEWRSFEL